jgi:hypothetical protein
MANPLPELPIPMTLTELLRHHFPPESTQKSIAMDWHDRLLKAGGKPRSPSYVESQFSRCFKGEASPVRFFFGERQHAVLLLDVMKVPESERGEILAAADRLMNASGEPPPRLVIDLTRWSEVTTAKQLFDTVRVKIVDSLPVQPAVLLLTDALYDLLPRSFDTAKWLRVEVIEVVDAAARVRELTDGGALLASPVCQVDPERWLAIDYRAADQALILEPADGLARFARAGALALPAVEHDLASWVADGAAASFDPTALDPIQQRRLMVRLRDESEAERVDPDPRRRLAMARALGIVAVATPRDRLEVELRIAAAGLGVSDVPLMSDEDFRALLDRARRRPSPQTVVRVGDEIHGVNLAPTHPGLEHPRVQVHRFDPPEPWISRLRAAVADWTIGDFEADPFLVGVMEQLDPDGRDVLALLHARAWLLHARAVRPRSAKSVDDWRGAVRSIVSEDVPEAMLRIVSSDLEMGTEREAKFCTLPPDRRAAATLPSIDADTAERLRHVPSPNPAVPFGRGAPLQIARPCTDRWSDRASTRLVLPGVVGEAGAAHLDERWLDVYDEFLASSRSPHGVPAIDVGQIREQWPWQEADSLLASAWLALRAAIDAAPAVRSTSGRVLIGLGAGIAAELLVTATAQDVGRGRAIVDCTTSGGRSHATLNASIATGVDSVKYTVPIGIVLLAGSVRVEVEFTASPLLLGVGGSMVPVAAARIAQAASDDAAWQAAYDDDDD